MTSNVSFWTNLKENSKRRSWATLLLGLYFFIIYVISPIVIISQVSRPFVNDELTYTQATFRSLMGANYFTGTCMAIFAILFALHGYSYLFNKRKVDFYASVPVSSKRRFLVIQVSGILTFIAIYLVFAILGLLIGLSAGLVTSTTLQFFLIGFLVNLLIFIALYELTTIATMMTGHFVIAFLALSVFSLYELLIRLLHQSFLQFFMQHILSYSMVDYVYSSPFFPYFIIIDKLSRSERILHSIEPAFLLTNILWLCGLCILFFILAYILYRKRPNEATDCAISFPKTKAYISIAIQVLAGLGGAAFFYSLTYDQYLMAIFGILFGCFLLFCTMNIIFEFDIRSIFKNWKTFIVSVSIALIYFLIVSLDLFGMDTYIPEKEEVVSCGIYSYELQMIGYEGEYYYYGSVKDADSALSEMEILEIDAFLALAEYGIDNNNTYNYSEKYRFYTICFHLENGDDVYRQYNIADSEAMSELETIFSSSSYIETIKDKIDDLAIKSYLDPYFYNGIYETHVSINNMDEIFEAYKKDLNYFSFDENILCSPISKWRIHTGVNNYIDLPIYDNFSYTLALLESYDLADDLKIEAREISKIIMYLNPVNDQIKTDTYDDTSTVVAQDVYIDRSTTITFTDPEEIASIYENCLPYDFSSFNYQNTSLLPDRETEYYVDISVYPKVGTTHEQELAYAYFHYDGDLPAFISENHYLNY